MSRPNTQDIDLRAVFMRNWSTIDERGEMHSGSGGAMGCDWLRDWHDVQRVCRHLGNIPVELIDLSRDYWVHVFEPALGQWSDGTTPNPDVECNRSIKFGALMDRVLGAQPREHSWLATGHYARLIRRDGYTMIARAADATKDQSFFLSSVPSSRLAHSVFPLGLMHKHETRALARKWALPTAENSESMGLCFVGERGAGAHAFARFLDGYVEGGAGDMITPDGTVVGTHCGLHTYTIGQRARLAGHTERFYVARKDPASRRITVVPGNTHPLLLCTALHVSTFHWTADVAHPPQLLAQVRYRTPPSPCTVKQHGAAGVAVRFDPPVAAVSPGQTIALYDGDVCLGSGTIDRVDTLA